MATFLSSFFKLVILNEVKDLVLWLTRFFATELKTTTFLSSFF